MYKFWAAKVTLKSNNCSFILKKGYVIEISPIIDGMM
jgi:hypothetical protein